MIGLLLYAAIGILLCVNVLFIVLAHIVTRESKCRMAHVKLVNNTLRLGLHETAIIIEKSFVIRGPLLWAILFKDAFLIWSNVLDPYYERMWNWFKRVVLGSTQ